MQSLVFVNFISSRFVCYQGDVGGPVTHTANGDASSSLVGVLSHSLDCPSRYPMAYTRIGPYIGWIRANVKNLLKY
jgi:secreted trypsin-like serine protease